VEGSWKTQLGGGGGGRGTELHCQKGVKGRDFWLQGTLFLPQGKVQIFQTNRGREEFEGKKGEERSEVWRIQWRRRRRT